MDLDDLPELVVDDVGLFSAQLYPLDTYEHAVSLRVIADVVLQNIVAAEVALRILLVHVGVLA